MLQRLMGRTKQVSSTYKVCLVHGAHSALLVSGVDGVSVTVPSSLSCCTLLHSARVTHLPSESCLMFFSGHLQKHLLVNSSMHIPAFLLSERKKLDMVQNYGEEANEIKFSMWTKSALLNGLSLILREAAAPSQQAQP